MPGPGFRSRPKHGGAQARVLAAVSARATAGSQLVYRPPTHYWWRGSWGLRVIELKIPEIYWDDEKAVSLLGEYFTRRRSCGDLFYSGACFERLGGGGDAEYVAYCFDSNDLVAITTLSVSLEPHGAINLLTDPDEHWASLLSLIPRDARLEDPRSDALIVEGGPAWELWERLAGTKQYPGKPDGNGPVVAGKLLARKRPHLIPIYDIRVKQLFNDRRQTTPSGQRWLRPCGRTTAPSTISWPVSVTRRGSVRMSASCVCSTSSPGCIKDGRGRSRRAEPSGGVRRGGVGGGHRPGSLIDCPQIRCASDDASC